MIITVRWPCVRDCNDNCTDFSVSESSDEVACQYNYKHQSIPANEYRHALYIVLEWRTNNIDQQPGMATLVCLSIMSVYAELAHLVQNYDGRVPQQTPGNGDSLLLAPCTS